jgi:nicotinamide-nucleotide amidase
MKDAKKLIEVLTTQGLKITTVESCTGGALASAITDIPGASAIFERGYVTYSTRAKESLAYTAFRGVPMAKAILEHTVYSHAVAAEMALIGCLNAEADIGGGIKGTISREDPANPKTPVGEVYIAIQILQGAPYLGHIIVPSILTRGEAKQLVVQGVLEMLIRELEKRNLV